MDYQIKSAKVNGDTVPLSSVAAGMAKIRATTGNGFHKSTYDGSVDGFTATLVSAANTGQLVVCNQFGDEMAPAEILKQAKASGRIIESSKNENTTVAMNVWVTLARLNQWGSTHGDTFAKEDGPWIDERGWQGLNGKPPPILKFDLKPAPAIQALPAVPNQPEAAKPAGDRPKPLTTGDIAHCFSGLHWSESEWRKPLGDKPKWLAECVDIPGQRGVRETRWNPVLIGAALERQGHATARNVRARFQSADLLKPWLDAWKTYEADYCDNE